MNTLFFMSKHAVFHVKIKWKTMHFIEWENDSRNCMEKNKKKSAQS